MSVVIYASSYTETKGFKGRLLAARITLQKWHQRNRERHQLAMMNTHQLKDIGLTITDAKREINKPYWHP